MKINGSAFALLLAVSAAALTACGGAGGGLTPPANSAQGGTGIASGTPTPRPSVSPSPYRTPYPTGSPFHTPYPTGSPYHTPSPTASPVPTPSAVPTPFGVLSACVQTGPSVCAPVSNASAVPYDAPLILHLAKGPVQTVASVSPSETVYAYGGVGANSVGIRWRRTPGVMYTITTNGATFNVTTQSPVPMPQVNHPPSPRSRYCVMGHTWTLQEQTIRNCDQNPCQNIPNGPANALIDSAEQAAANAGATCARVEIQASFIWGGLQGNLNGLDANWTTYDYIATHLAQHGISMFPIILQYGGTRFQQTVGMNKAFANVSDYGTYAGTVTQWIVQHNQQMAQQNLPQITQVELLNEPNQSYWFYDSDTGPGIAAFLRAGYAAVKANDPSLFVYGPALANGGGEHTNMFSDMTNIYAAGCRTGNCWDGISIHNFAWQMDPTVYWGPTFEGQWQNYKGIEAIANANNDSGVKICLTESGFASDQNDAWSEDPQVAALDMSLAYGTAFADPQIACIVNASIWDGDDGGGSYSAIGLGSTTSGSWVNDPRYQSFGSWAL